MNPAEHELSVIKESPEISKDVRLFFVNIIYWLIENIAKVNIDQESQDNLQALDEQLKISSIVMYGYHSSVLDSIILPIVLRKHLNNLDTMIAPVAITHSQGIQKVVLDFMSYLTNTKFLPVVREKDEPYYEPEFKTQLVRQLIKITKESLSESGNMYGLAPMGAREKILREENMNPTYIKVAQKRKVPLVAAALFKSNTGKLIFNVGKIIEYPNRSTPLDELTPIFTNYLAQLLPTELLGDSK